MQCTLQEALQPFIFSESGLAGFVSVHFHLMGWVDLRILEDCIVVTEREDLSMG